MKNFTLKHLFVVLFHLFILRLVAIAVVAFAVLLSFTGLNLLTRKAKRKTTHYGQGTPPLDVQRYVLRGLLGIFSSCDEDGWPMYEKTVASVYNKFGWRGALFYNLGLRNQAQGWLWLFGYEVTEQAYLNNKLLDYKLMNKDIDLKLFKLRYGWEIAHDHYRDYTTTGFYAIPQLEIIKRN